MTAQFAFEIDLKSGDTRVSFGEVDTPAHALALTIRDSWRSYGRDDFFTITDSTTGQSRDIHIRDITDVRVRVGDDR